MGRKVREAMADRKDDDEDEAPEEVTLGQGREEAEKLKKEEKEGRRRVAAEAKARRKLRSGPKNLEVEDPNLDTQVANDEILESAIDIVSVPEDTSAIPSVSKLDGAEKGPNSDEQLKLDDVDKDPNTDEQIQTNDLEKHGSLLDASVVQYLTAREKRMHTTISDAKEKEMKVKTKTSRKKLRQEKADYDGATRVELLSSNDKATSYNAKTAVQFLRDQLYGSRVRRSYAMVSRLYKEPAKAS